MEGGREKSGGRGRRGHGNVVGKVVGGLGVWAWGVRLGRWRVFMGTCFWACVFGTLVWRVFVWRSVWFGRCAVRVVREIGEMFHMFFFL